MLSKLQNQFAEEETMADARQATSPQPFSAQGACVNGPHSKTFGLEAWLYARQWERWLLPDALAVRMHVARIVGQCRLAEVGLF
jgi:hypothetical protein